MVRRVGERIEKARPGGEPRDRRVCVCPAGYYYFPTRRRIITGL